MEERKEKETERETHLEERVYLSIQDVEELYALKASFQAKYRIDPLHPMPYFKPGGSNKVIYRRVELEAWIEKSRIEAA